MPKISIIVPVYNTEKYLERCIDSLINQTFSDIEIILVDDGSTDKSLEICNSYAKKDKRINVISQKNSGPSVARNNALKIAQGEFVGFVDSDDYILSDTYEKAIKCMTDDINLVVWGVNVLSDDALPYIQWFEQNYFKIKFNGKVEIDENIMFSTSVVPWNKLYRKSIIDSHNIIFPEGRLYEDNAFWWKYTRWCDSIFFLQEKFHFYNMRVSSLRGEVIHKKNDKETDRIYMVEDVYDYCIKENLLSEKTLELLSKLYLDSFIDAYDETSAKLAITVQAKNLALKMNLLNSQNNSVVKLVKSIITKCSCLEKLNSSLDLKLNFSFAKNLSENDLVNIIQDIKKHVDCSKNKNTDILDSQSHKEAAISLCSTIINDYFTKLSLSEEFEYLKDYYQYFPDSKTFPYNTETLKIILNFTHELLKNKKTEELIKFANIFKALYPQVKEFDRVLGDAYMFLKKQPAKAFYYYKNYTDVIKNNESVYNVMSEICGSYKDVFHQIFYKQKALKASLNKN